MTQLTDMDKAILNRIQSGFPITQRPFKTIGDEIGAEESEVIERVQSLKNKGIIRRIGGNFVPEKMGYVSTLCAAKVPPEKVSDFAAVVNRFTGVTHNYERDNPFNVWFTFIAKSMEEIEENLKTISMESGVTEIINLPSYKVFKIKAQFHV